MARHDASCTLANFAVRSTFEVCVRLPRSLLHGFDISARLHCSPHEPELLYFSVSCRPKHAIPDPDVKAAAWLEAVVRRLDSRRM